MRRVILIVGSLSALFVLTLTVSPSRTVVTAQNGNGKGHTPVTICHNTGSQSNPVIVITVDDDAVPAHIANHGDSLAREGQCEGAKEKKEKD